MSNTIDISHTAMLCSVTISLEGLLGERKDREATSLVTSQYKTDKRRAKASKFLIDRSNMTVRRVISSAQNIRMAVYKYTFPWGNQKNIRILPARVFDEFNLKLETAIADHKSAIDDYIQEYPSLVRRSEDLHTGLGHLFDLTQYPPVEQVRKLFRQEVMYRPVPASGHFVADIVTEAVTTVREQIEKSNTARINEAVNDLIGRVEQTVSNYVDKLANYKPAKGYTEGIFRDSLVDNVKEMARLVDRLNFSGDPQIAALSGHISRLARYSADYLRHADHPRNEIASEGKLLLSRLGAYRRSDNEIDTMVSEMNDYL